jgi:hypothetical protein
MPRSSAGLGSLDPVINLPMQGSTAQATVSLVFLTWNNAMVPRIIAEMGGENGSEQTHRRQCT